MINDLKLHSPAPCRQADEIFTEMCKYRNLQQHRTFSYLFMHKEGECTRRMVYEGHSGNFNLSLFEHGDKNTSKHMLQLHYIVSDL